MKEYLLLTVDEAEYEALCGALNALPITVIKARVTPSDYSWAQWGVVKDQLIANLDAVEAVFAALLDAVGIREQA